MRYLKGLLLILGIFAVFSLFFLFYEGSKEEKNFRIGLTEKPATLDPAVAFDDYTLTVTGEVYEPLYQYHYLKRPYEVVPLMADGFPEFFNDGKTLRIHLKKDIQYHQIPIFKGKRRTVRAEDFLNQFKRMAFEPLNSPGRWFFSKKIKGFQSFQERVGRDWRKIFEEPLEGIEVIDELTFDIHFLEAEPHALHYLTMAFVVPIPEEAIVWAQNDFSQKTIGTGPFYMASHDLEKIVLKKFSGYREEQYPSSGDRFANTENLLGSRMAKIPFLDMITIEAFGKEEELWAEFLEKKLDMIRVPESYQGLFGKKGNELRKRLQKMEAVIRQSPSLSMKWLSFNMNNSLWGKNKKLRQAIAYGINVKAYLQEVFENTKLEANSIFNPGVLGYRPERGKSYPYSIKKARKLLEEAGHPDGKGLPKLNFYTRNSRPLQKKSADFLKRELQKIGVDLVIHIQSFREYLELARSDDNPMDMWFDGWIYDYPDPENIMQLLLSTNGAALNKTRFFSMDFDSAYYSYLRTQNQEEKLKFLGEAEKIAARETPWIPLFYESSLLLTQKEVRNFRWSSIINNYLKYVDKEGD